MREDSALYIPQVDFVYYHVPYRCVGSCRIGALPPLRPSRGLQGVRFWYPSIGGLYEINSIKAQLYSMVSTAIPRITIDIGCTETAAGVQAFLQRSITYAKTQPSERFTEGWDFYSYWLS